MLDPEFYKNTSKNCIELCKKTPGRPENYKIVSRKSLECYEYFLENLCKKFKECLINSERETINFEKCVENITSTRLLADILAERDARYKLGSQCTVLQQYNYEHYSQKSDVKLPSTASKLNIRAKDLCSMSNVSGILTTQNYKEIHKYYVEDKDNKWNTSGMEKSGISSLSIQTKVRYIGTPSSFWSAIKPIKDGYKLKYIESNEILESNLFLDLPKNISDITKFLEKYACSADFANSSIDLSVYNTTTSQSPDITDSPSPNNANTTEYVINASNPSLSSHTNVSDTSSISLPPPPLFDDSVMSTPPPPPSMPSSNVSPKQEKSTASPVLDDPLPMPPLPTPPLGELPKPPIRILEARYDYTGTSSRELDFKRGDKVEIITENDNGWDIGRLRGKEGFVPRNFFLDI